MTRAGVRVCVRTVIFLALDNRGQRAVSRAHIAPISRRMRLYLPCSRSRVLEFT